MVTGARGVKHGSRTGRNAFGDCDLQPAAAKILGCRLPCPAP
jgi:hypothetical protein